MLSIEQEKDIFSKLAYKSALDVGLEVGLSSVYKDNKAIRNSVMNIYRKVAKNPQKWGIGNDVADIVKSAMGNRSLVKTRVEISKEELDENPKNFVELVTTVRNKSWNLIDRKLARAGKSNKRLDAVSFRDLGTLAGISLDKALLLSGQATEHIAIMGKIEGDVSATDALKMVLEMREKNVADKHKVK